MFMEWIRWEVPCCWVICIVIAKDEEMFLSIVIGIFDDLECWLGDYESLESSSEPSVNSKVPFIIPAVGGRSS